MSRVEKLGSRISGRAGALVYSLGVLLLCQLGSPLRVVASETNQVALAWEPSPCDCLVGYTVYYGSQSGVYTNRIWFDNVTNATITGLSAGVVYYFAATATDSEGLESDFSNEVTYSVPLWLSPPAITLLTAGQISVFGLAVPRASYDLLASQDLAVWRVAATVTADADGVYQANVPGGTNSAEFYRLLPLSTRESGDEDKDLPP
jgi:hypothetical protein